MRIKYRCTQMQTEIPIRIIMQVYIAIEYLIMHSSMNIRYLHSNALLVMVMERIRIRHAFYVGRDLQLSRKQGTIDLTLLISR